MKREVSKEELNQHLQEQIYFLETSSRAYDEGSLIEAKRLALTLRVLLHDTNNSHSLLNQLGIKSSIGFVDTCYDRDTRDNLFPGTSPSWFLGIKLSFKNPQGVYVPLLKDTGLGTDCTKPFDEWWTKIVIENSTHSFTRQNIILLLANQDGGGHIDPKLDEDFAKLTRDNSLGFTTFNIKEQAIIAPALAATRQIAFEFLKSLELSQPPNNKSTKRPNPEQPTLPYFIIE